MRRNSPSLQFAHLAVYYILILDELGCYSPFIFDFRCLVFVRVPPTFRQQSSACGAGVTRYFSLLERFGSSPPFGIYTLVYPKTRPSSMRRRLTFSDETHENSLHIGSRRRHLRRIYDVGRSYSAQCTISGCDGLVPIVRFIHTTVRIKMRSTQFDVTIETDSFRTRPWRLLRK
jgi:hypothetical protein